MKNKETLEEFANNYSSNELSKLGFINGAKWQAERIQNLRDELYNQLPSGEVSPFDLIKIINSHIKKIDEKFKNK